MAEGINVLSLFDGMSCGQIALERAGIKVANYYASEIDKYAIQITQKNYPNTIQLGDVRNWSDWDLPKIDIIIGGSPCQDLSRIKSKDGRGLNGEKSKLFYEFSKVLKNTNPRYFLLENVLMNKDSEEIITSELGVYPTEINSSLFSAQDRRRLYWTNIEINKDFPNCPNVLKDVMESDVDSKYFYLDSFDYHEGKRVVATLNKKLNETNRRVYDPNYKAPTLTAVCGGHQEKKVLDNGRPRKLTPIEYERLQTVPDNYTGGVSNTQRYKMLGNGWTVDVIAHIFEGIKEYNLQRPISSRRIVG